MLRINLLPSYVQQRRLTKTLIPIFIAVFALFVAVPLAAYFYERGQLAHITQEANDAVAGKGKTDALKTEATTTTAQVAPIQATTAVCLGRECFYPQMGGAVQYPGRHNPEIQLYLHRRVGGGNHDVD